MISELTNHCCTGEGLWSWHFWSSLWWWVVVMGGCLCSQQHESAVYTVSSWHCCYPGSHHDQCNQTVCLLLLPCLLYDSSCPRLHRCICSMRNTAIDITTTLVLGQVHIWIRVSANDSVGALWCPWPPLLRAAQVQLAHACHVLFMDAPQRV